MGYVYNNDAVQPYDVCLNKEKGKCHYRLDPYSFNGSVVLYVGNKCVCIRSWCKLLMVNHVFNITYNAHKNQCFCNVTLMIGCDFNLMIPATKKEEIKDQLQLYKKIDPIPIRMNVSLVKQLINIQTYKDNSKRRKKMRKRLLFTHSADKIEQIIERIKADTKHSWWKIFLGWSHLTKGLFNIILHPVVVVLAFQGVMALMLIVLVCWIKQKFRQLKNMNSINIERNHDGIQEGIALVRIKDGEELCQ